MKRAYLFLVMPLLITACKPKSPTSAAASKTDSVAYPYTIKHPDQWKMDTSHTNALAALNLLKAVEKNDTAEMRKYFADSVDIDYDNGVFKGSIKELLTLVKKENANIKDVHIEVYDWESVVSKIDSNEQWVTVWYKQKSTDLKGKTDSIQYVDDEQFKNGKVVKLNEYARHYKKH